MIYEEVYDQSESFRRDSERRKRLGALSISSVSGSRASEEDKRGRKVTRVSYVLSGYFRRRFEAS